MANSVRVAMILTLLGCSAVFAACSGDNDDSGASAGSGGSAVAGAHSGGSSGASTGGKGGSTSTAGTGGGQAGRAGAGNDQAGAAGNGEGGAAQAGAAGNGEGGAAQAGAANGEGGAAQAGAANGEGGAAQAGAANGDGGAAGEAGLVYACGSDTLTKKLCSAWSAANCATPVDCSDCVTNNADLDSSSFSTCDTCVKVVESAYNCSINAYENGHLSDGVICDDQGGPGLQADFSDACGQLLGQALDCQSYVATPNNCPSAWPMP